ncbi:MAG TPA: hypothetical protein VM076_16335 [Gemmatimonadaceae bacterium]|nr:hypothetical protein [Gemmatimonadaceae bacterium]
MTTSEQPQQAAVGSLLLSALFAVSCAVSARAQAPCDVFCHSRLADQAAAAGNYAQYLAHARNVAAIAPSHPGVAFALTRAFARTGQPDSAIAWLTRLGTMGDTRDPNADSLLRPLRTRAGYDAARNRLLSNRLPILDGKVAFDIDDPDFIPEAIAYDSTRQRFIAGSLSKRLIAAVAADGETSAFIPHTPEMLRVVGIHIDAPRGRLWFATWGPDTTFRGTGEPPSLTRLFLAELATGRIVRSWTPDGGKPSHLLNDFVVMGDGSLFITDTERGTIYRLRSPSDTLEVFVQPAVDRFSTANGITSTPDGSTLYIAFLQGIARVDVATRTVSLLPAPDSVSIASIDGLYWYRGSLIAVQGIPTLSRVVRYTLSDDGQRVTDGAVLERGLPVLREPTTGVIVGSRFYYIANAQYGRLPDRGGPPAPQRGTPARTSVRVIELR